MNRNVDTIVISILSTKKINYWKNPDPKSKPNKYEIQEFCFIYCLGLLLDSDVNINRDALPYMKVAIMTRKVPMIKYPPGIRSFSTR